MTRDSTYLTKFMGMMAILIIMWAVCFFCTLGMFLIMYSALKIDSQTFALAIMFASYSQLLLLFILYPTMKLYLNIFKKENGDEKKEVQTKKNRG